MPAETSLADLLALELEPPPYFGTSLYGGRGLDYFGNLMLPGACC